MLEFRAVLNYEPEIIHASGHPPGTFPFVKAYPENRVAHNLSRSIIPN